MRDETSGPVVSRRDALRRLALGLAGAPLLAGTEAVDSAGVRRRRTADASRAGPGGGPGPRTAVLGRPAAGGRGTVGPAGVQLYTLRQAMAESVEATLDRVAAMGYREVEFAGYFGRSPREIRRALDAAGLTAPSAHVGLGALEDWPATLEAAGVLGHGWLVIPSLPPEMRATLDDWRRTAARLGAAGQAARARGIGLAFHNHAGPVRPLEGVVPLELLLRETRPEHLSVQVDVYWMLEGGMDPVAFLERWPGRVPSLHLKDRAADGSMADVGAGVVDWPAVLSAGRRAGVRHLFVEHDRPPDPFASVEASYRYLDRLELP